MVSSVCRDTSHGRDRQAGRGFLSASRMRRGVREIVRMNVRVDAQNENGLRAFLLDTQERDCTPG